ATLDGELEAFEARAGRAPDSHPPDQQARSRLGERGCGDVVSPAEPATHVAAVEPVGRPLGVADYAEQVELIVMGLRHLLLRGSGGHGAARLVACFAFFSLRFSLSVFPDRFDCCWRGDLSAISCSLP